MSHRTLSTREWPGKQRGAALLLFFLVVLVTGTLFVAGQFALDRGSVQYEDNTTEALAKAKQALIAYAVTYYQTDTEGVYAILPCPEGSGPGEGLSAGNCNATNVNTTPGRLPWRSLEIKNLVDGSGECLWYAVSGGYKENPPSAMLNEDTPGMFRLLDDNLNVIRGSTPEDRVVAVVIAPGPQLPGQNRPAATPGLPCKVAYNDPALDPADYLEAVGGVDNSDVSGAADDRDDFVTALNLQGANINDRIVTVTAGEIFDAIKRQNAFDTRMANLTEGLALCVANYAEQNRELGGTGCNLVQCQQDCRDAERDCNDQCRTDRHSCRDQCNADRDACRAAGGRPRDCNQVRNDCRRACDDTWRTCGDNCGAQETSCQAWCDANCTAGGGGAGGPDIFRMPWPAPENLAADYRDNASYQDITAGDVGTEGLLGRLPYNVANSNAELPSPPTDNELFSGCTGIPVAGNAVDFSDSNEEYRRLYDHWKDHFFYVVGGAYAPDSGDNACTNGCPGTDGNADAHAAILFYAGERLAGQLRRTVQTDPATPLAQSKGDITNYLDGANAANHPDASGDADDYTGLAPVNDIYCYINDNRPDFEVTCP